MNVFSQFLFPLAPTLALVMGGCVLIAAECVGPNFLNVRAKSAVAWLAAAIAVGLCFYQLGHLPAESNFRVGGGPVWLTEFTHFYSFTSTTVLLQLLVALFALFVLNAVSNEFKRGDILGEVLALLLWSGSGMMLLVSADHFLLVFLGLELLSLPLYAMVGLRRWDPKSLEAALKYFLFGSVATAFLLLGIAFIYAETGTLSLPKLRDIVASIALSGSLTDHVLLLSGMMLLIVALGFKAGMFPFHMWLPDVYEGAPAGITAWMGSAVKLAAVGLTFRIFVDTFGTLPQPWLQPLRYLVAATILVGNAAALVQDDLKRTFAYSSIGHAGFLMLGVLVSSGDLGAQPNALLYYLLTYGLMFIGMFSFLAHLERQGLNTEFSEISGLGFSSPGLGLCLATFALSAAGIPPLAGFFAKYQILLLAFQKGQGALAVIALIGSAIGLAYYLRVLVFLYMKEPKSGVRLSAKSEPVGFGLLAVLALATFVLGFMPGLFGR